MNANNPSSFEDRWAFTSVELLVVIAVMVVLASLLLPAVSTAKQRAQSVSCQSNLRQIQSGLQMYLHDHADHLPRNRFGSVGFIQQSFEGWILGNAQHDTNTDGIKNGVIFKYVGNVAVYRCPSDHAPVISRPLLKRSRSYAFNSWLHSDGSSYGLTISPEFNVDQRTTMGRLGTFPPSECWTFLEQHPGSIDDGVILLSLPYSWSDPNVPADTSLWYELPADRHQRGCSIAFLDGRVIPNRWKFPKIFQPPAGQGQRAKHDLEDLRWLQHHTPNE